MYTSIMAHRTLSSIWILDETRWSVRISLNALWAIISGGQREELGKTVCTTTSDHQTRTQQEHNKKAIEVVKVEQIFFDPFKFSTTLSLPR